MGGRKVSLHLHPSLTEVISLLRVKPTLARVTFWQKGVLIGPWKRGSQGPMLEQAGDAAMVQSPTQTDPSLSPLCSTLLSLPGWELGSVSQQPQHLQRI